MSRGGRGGFGGGRGGFGGGGRDIPFSRRAASTNPMALPDTTEELKAHLNAILEEPKTQIRVRLVQTFTAQLVDVGESQSDRSVVRNPF